MSDQLERAEAYLASARHPVTADDVRKELRLTSPAQARTLIASLIRVGKAEAVAGTTPMQFRAMENTKTRISTDTETDTDIVIGGRCGYCDPMAKFSYHRDRCPGIIRGAAAGGKTWGCRCYFDKHRQAYDYETEEEDARTVDQ